MLYFKRKEKGGTMMKLNSYASLEIGTHFTKLLVAEFNKGNVYVVAYHSIETKGYQNGTITNTDELVSCLLELFSEVEKKFKIKVDELILIFPAIDHKVHMAGANMAIQTPMHLIGMNEIQKIRLDCRNVQLAEGETAVDECPIKYVLDSGKTLYTIPLNLQSNTLQLTSYIHSLPTSLITPLLKVFETLHIDLLDAYLLPFCCFSLMKNHTDEPILLLHYDYDAITFAYFDKQQLLKTDRLDFGEKNLLQVLQQTFQVDAKEALTLLDSYFITDINQATSTILDAQKGISEEAVSQCIQNELQKISFSIQNKIQQYSQEFSTSFEIKISGKWLNYRHFVSYFNQINKLYTKGVYLNVLGINSNEFLPCYGAIIRFISLNKDYILNRDEDDNQKPNFMNQTQEYATHSQSTSKKFVDIFDEEE